MSQKGRTMFHVVGNFAKSLEVTQNYTTEYGTDKSLLVFHCDHICTVYHFQVI